jgi:hypothetical protein
MDLALVERLVCPFGHVRTPLVVRVDHLEHGRVITGAAGCSVCDAEWPIVDGALVFGPAKSTISASSIAPDDLAALMGLSEPGALVVMDGASAETVKVLTRVYGARVVVIDARVQDAAAATVGAPRIPFFNCARAVALQGDACAEPLLASAADALIAGGRFIASVRAALPAGVKELARNDIVWVAEREHAGNVTREPIELVRRRR